MTVFHERIKGIVDDIEGLDALDKLDDSLAGWIGRATRRDAVKNALSGTWLGHQLHPVLTDLPIGAWVMASALDCTTGRSGDRAARRLVALGVLTALPAAAAGASDWSNSYGAGQRVGLVHAVSNLTATVLQATSWVARQRGHRLTGVALSSAGLGVTICAAYLGGHLSFVLGVGVNNTVFQPAVTEWTDVAAVSALSPDKPMRVTAGGVPVVLVHHDGTHYALSATCVHASGPLDQGKLVGNGNLQCPWHHSTFRLAGGAVVRGPAAIDQPSWEVKVDGGRVYVRSSALADA